MLRFLAPATQASYPKLMGTPADFYFELYHLCVLIQIRQAAADHGGRDVHERGEEAAKRVLEVFEIFENEPASLRFIAGIFPTVAARSRARIDDFDDFSIAELPDLAHLGNEVLNRVSGMHLAEKALTALYLTHLREAPPAHWKQLFREAARMAYNLKYMFRESLPKAKARFLEQLDCQLTGEAREVYAGLVQGALGC